MSKSLAKIDNPVVEKVANDIQALTDARRLRFPKNYNPQNALYGAWLELQNVKDRNGKPALQVCTKDSVQKALLGTVVMGLSPVKKQIYYIVYGNQLTAMPSYFGHMAIAKRVTKCKHIFAEVVYEDDDFEFEVQHGNKVVTKHKQKLQNIRKDKMIGAYCTIICEDDTAISEIMTMDEVHKAWAKSKMNINSDSSTHQQFPQEMAKRTVINRACKALIRTSDDSDLDLVLEYVNAADGAADDAQIDEEVAERANAEVLDADFSVQPESEEVFVDDADKVDEAEEQKPKKTAKGTKQTKAPF